MKEEIKLWNAEVEMAEHIGDKKDSDEINTFINKLRAKIPTLEASGITMTVEDDIENNGNDVIGYKVKINGEEIYIKIPQNTVKTEQGAKKAEIEEIINTYNEDVLNTIKTENDVIAEIKAVSGWEQVVKIDENKYTVKFLDNNKTVALLPSGRLDITFTYCGTNYTVKSGTTVKEFIDSQNFANIWLTSAGYYYKNATEISDDEWENYMTESGYCEDIGFIFIYYKGGGEGFVNEDTVIGKNSKILEYDGILLDNGYPHTD